MNLKVINNKQNGALYKDFDPAAVTYEEPRKSSNGGIMVPFHYQVDGALNDLIIQTQRMRGPFGISKFQRDGNKAPQLSLQVTFGEEDTEFLRLIQSLDKVHVKAGVENVTKWFSRPMLPHAVEVLYKKTPVESKDPSKYRPTIRFKINKDSQFWDESQNPIDVKDIPAGAEFIVLAKTNVLWFTGGQFAPTFTLLQAKVFKPQENKLLEYSIQDDDDQMF